MKKRILLFILFFIILQVSYSQDWKTVFDKPTYSLLVKGDTLFAGSNLSIMWYSTDNGDTWSWTNFVGYENNKINVLATDGDNIYAGKADGLFISRDNGQNWNKAKLPDSIRTLYPLAVNKNYAFTAPTYSGFWYSSDYGNTWQQDNLNFPSIISLGWKGDTLFAGGGALWMSTDYGQTWDTISSDRSPFFITFKGDSIYVAEAGRGIFLTSDFGKSWKQVLYSFDGVYHPIIFINDTMVVGDPRGGFSISTAGGEDIQYSYDNRHVSALLFYNGYLFAGYNWDISFASGKIIRWKWSDIKYFVRVASVGEETNSANIFIFPNPARDYVYFNSSLIDGAGMWQYQIYDILGNCAQSGAIESNKINISRLSSGFYTVRFFNGGKQVVEKMMKE